MAAALVPTSCHQRSFASLTKVLLLAGLLVAPGVSAGPAAQTPTAPSATPSASIAPLAPPVASAPPTSAAPLEPAPGVCESGWSQRVYLAAAGSVVKITTNRGLGAGFVFGVRNRIATAFHVVKDQRAWTVSFADGEPHPARVVAVDIEHDLALLDIDDSPASATPLQAAERAPVIGDPLLAIGHPFGTLPARQPKLRGVLLWSASVGIVSNQSDRFLQTDAALNRGNSGGPLLSCTGRVLGVVSQGIADLSQGVTDAEGLGMAIAKRHLEALAAAVGHAPDDPGGWSLRGLLNFSAGGVWYGQADQSLRGVAVGLELKVAEQLRLRLQTDLAWGSSSSAQLLPDTSRREVIALALEQHRRLFSFELAPSLGGAVAAAQVERRSLSFSFDSPGCFPPQTSCAPRTEVSTSTSHSLRLYPTVGVALVQSNLRLGYSFLVHVGQLDRSFHQVFLGLTL